MPLDINIKRQTDSHRNTTLTVELGGSLDTATAPQLEAQLTPALDAQVKDLIFDLAKLTFISSAGLCPALEYESEPFVASKIP